MSRLCRLRNAEHGDDGQWAYNEIVSLRRELKNMTDQYNAALEAEQVRYRQVVEKDAEIERLKGMVDEIQAARHMHREHNRMLANLAASQAREQQLREALGLNVVRNPKYPWKPANNYDNCPACFEMFDLDKCEHCGSGYDDEYIHVKESTNTTALSSMIAKAGEVMRERCAKHLESCAQSFAEEYGHDDLGCLSFGSGAAAELRMDTFNGWMEDADAIRALPAVTLDDLKGGA